MIMFCVNLVIVSTSLISAADGTGVYRLPITRTTTGLYFIDPGVSQAQDHVDQTSLAGPFPHVSLLKLKNHDSFLGSITKDVKLRTLGRDTPDDDEEGWDIMFFSVYTAPISVGNPPLQLTATVDTSWSTLFIPSANCTYNPGEIRHCMLHPLYNSSLSSTYRQDLRPARLSYTGPAGLDTYGNISIDNVRVAGMEIKEQIFQEAIMLRPDIGTRDDLFDSALGLSLFPTRSGYRANHNFAGTSPFENMMQQKLLKENVISIKFGRNDLEVGELVLGGLPTGLQREQMIEIPLDHSTTDDTDHIWRYYTMNGWQIPVQDISMTSNSTGASFPVLNKPQIAVVASSFPWIGLPNKATQMINAVLGFGIMHAFDWIDCDRRSELPNWTIAFGPNGQTITLTPWDYLIETYDTVFKQLKCVSAFYNMGDYGDKGFILLGSAFLNGLYSVFDADRRSISFANRPLQSSH